MKKQNPRRAGVPVTRGALIQSQLERHFEDHILFLAAELLDLATADLLQSGDHLLDQHFRRRSPGRHPHRGNPGEPVNLQLRRLVDQISGRPQPLGQLAQTVGVGRVASTDHDE